MKHLAVAAAIVAAGSIGAFAPTLSGTAPSAKVGHGHSHHLPCPAPTAAYVPPRASGTTVLRTLHDRPFATITGVPVVGSSYGSAFTAAPCVPGLFYGLTDRGPNVDAPDGGKIEPMPTYTPRIGAFLVTPVGVVQLASIPLRAKDGTLMNGQVNPDAPTNETLLDLAGKPLPTSSNGIDPEGLVAMPDGSFWVSDEYGPFVVHFSPTGRELERLSPFTGTLPTELKLREPNKGMEGLTVTPDGKTLVGIMQAALNTPGGPKSKNSSVVRIVTIDLATRATRELVYVLHNTSGAATTVSEITALSNTELLVDERDGKMEPGANKKLFKISLAGATDVGPSSTVPGATYDGGKGGLQIGGKTLEAIAGKQSTAGTEAALRAVGVTPVTSSLFLDVAGLVTSIDPTGGYYGHDKVEGLAVVDGGRRLVISNDSDFGLGGVNEASAPWTLQPKQLPNGKQDTGELLVVDMAKVPAPFKG